MKLSHLKKNYAVYLLMFFFILALTIRLYLAFQTPYFSDDASYFTLRQVQEITETGTPVYHDSLSYGGRLFVFPPLFHYILAFFNLFMPLAIVGKILPNLFASSLIIIVYFLAKEITKDKTSSLYTAAISGFIPVFFQKTINSVSPYSIVVPLFAFSIFCFIKLRTNKSYVYPLLIAISSLTFIHASALLLVLALLLYFIFLKVEGIKEVPIELEVVLFSAMLVIWFLLIIYKKALLIEGVSIIWQNIPYQLISRYFKDITVLEAIAKIGIVPFLYGIVTIYRYLFRKRVKFTYLFISFALMIGLLLIMRSIVFSVGLMFLGMILTILYSIHLKQFKSFIKKTKFDNLKHFLFISLGITLILTQFLPSLVFANSEIQKVPNDIQIDAYFWIAENTAPKAKVLSIVEDGHKIAFFSGRKNMMDSNFLNAGDTSGIYDDMIKIYRTQYKTQAIELLNKYDIDYIFFSEKVKKEFNIKKLSYISDENCFKPVYDVGEGEERIIIYESRCRLG